MTFPKRKCIKVFVKWALLTGDCTCSSIGHRYFRSQVHQRSEYASGLELAKEPHPRTPGLPAAYFVQNSKVKRSGQKESWCQGKGICHQTT